MGLGQNISEPMAIHVHTHTHIYRTHPQVGSV